MSEASQPNVLIFDSGVGGLSVYQEVQAMLPSVNYYYLFDNAAYPYGELDQNVLVERVVALVSHMVIKHHIDLVVIACNTASTIVLPQLRELLTIPVVGVVPAIKPASILANKAVALIATPATITRQYTHDLIRDFAKDTQVKLLGSTRLVDMAEEKLRGNSIDLKELAGILAPIVTETDVAVLGCTHFPLIREEIASQLGNGIVLVDSGQAIARRVKELLLHDAGSSTADTRRIFSTAIPWGEEALNQSVAKMGFTKIEPCLLQHYALAHSPNVP